MPASLRPWPLRSPVTRTSSSGLEKGSGLRSTAFTTEKMAVLAPMPRASVATATAAKPGLRASIRSA
jgi:hypothetical protein